MPGSGKSYSSGIMEKEGYRIFEMSSVITKLMEKRHIPIDQYTMREFSNSLRVERGKDIVSKLVAHEISKLKGDVAIFGIRSPAEVNYFKKHIKGRELVVIAITAPQKTRYKRIIGAYRNRKDEVRTYKEFLWREGKETKWGLERVIGMADFIIANYGTRAEFSRNIRKLTRYLLSGEYSGKGGRLKSKASGGR